MLSWRKRAPSSTGPAASSQQRRRRCCCVTPGRETCGSSATSFGGPACSPRTWSSRSTSPSSPSIPRSRPIARESQRRPALLSSSLPRRLRSTPRTGDPHGPARHAGQQERGGAAPPGGLQDPAREDQAVRHFRRTVPAVLTVVSRQLVPWRRRHGVRTMVLPPHQTLGADHLARPSAPSFTLTRGERRFLSPAPPLSRFSEASPSAHVEPPRPATRGASRGTCLARYPSR